jgi:hypothetical protein
MKEKILIIVVLCLYSVNLWALPQAERGGIFSHLAQTV